MRCPARWPLEASWSFTFPSLQFLLFNQDTRNRVLEVGFYFSFFLLLLCDCVGSCWAEPSGRVNYHNFLAESLATIAGLIIGYWITSKQPANYPTKPSYKQTWAKGRGLETTSSSGPGFSSLANPSHFYGTFGLEKGGKLKFGPLISRFGSYSRAQYIEPASQQIDLEHRL